MSNPGRNNQIDYVEFNAATQEALNQASKFYADAFGWEYKAWGPEYSDTHSSGVTSGIAVGRKPPLAVIYCTDLADAKARVLRAGAKVVQDIFAFPGGRRFHFEDPAGNELAVWSDK